MARDGQGARDYGTHLLPESDWYLYGTCPEERCRQLPGEPCRDLRSRHLNAYNWRAHWTRPLLKEPKQ